MNLLRVTQPELTAYMADSSLFADYLDSRAGGESTYLYLDKAWDGLSFLLTGQLAGSTNHPLADLFFSGQLIDEERDVGYGPAHYLTPADVRALNEWLAELSTETLRARYDEPTMVALNVYPRGSWSTEMLEEYLLPYFRQLQQHYATAATNGEGMIMWLS